MVSYSSQNGKKMHANRDLITSYLKNKIKFRGFVISDWQGLDRITSPPHANYSYSVEVGVSSGIDMVMVSFNYIKFIDDFTYQVKHNIILMSRMDDARKRIMRVKFVLGLFENLIADTGLVNQLGNQKNGKSADKPLLPLLKKTTKVLVTGSHADNLGYQGCRTITWKVDSTTQVVYNENPSANYVKSNKFSYAIVIVGGPSYAKTFSYSLNLTIPESGPSNSSNVCRAVKCVADVISGQPVVMQPYFSTIMRNNV
ncbi:Detected protein of confused Function [Hibiscus syriacus]|uniref:beta-glucosidase n=1 Tax=Hibiscus syriacus TaxID=106335 RepID=A0A6A2XP04_HIBSY|nr:Detected protein of confused Function [Hibiscus syriacus]